MKGYQPKFLATALMIIPLVLGGCLMDDTMPPPDAAVPDVPPPVNNAPTISGTPPAQIIVGQNYSFAPTAIDQDGDKLTFSVQNKPSWLAFDSDTGALTGTPQSGDLGTYDQVLVSVSDGSLAAELPRFSIAVMTNALGSATLSWTPPTQNDDGSPLLDLAGYIIYYGTSPTALDISIPIDNPGITTFIVEDLVPDTYYFAMTAVNSLGVESNLSGVASKTIS